MSEEAPTNDDQITYSGGAGEVYTITARGAMTIDTHAAQPIVWVSSGQTFTGTVTGTGRGTLRTSGNEFYYEPSADSGITETVVVDTNGPALGPPTLDAAFAAIYTCTTGRSFTFYRTQVNFMVEGSKVTLTAGNSNS